MDWMWDAGYEMIKGTLRNLTGRTGIMFGNGEAQGGSNLGQEELGQNEELQVHFESLSGMLGMHLYVPKTQQVCEWTLRGEVCTGDRMIGSIFVST